MKKESKSGNDSPAADTNVDPAGQPDTAKGEKGGAKEEAIDKKEEARLKLKELIRLRFNDIAIRKIF